jgi:uncharacterized protein YjiS (DUF1127 family)
MIRGQTLPSIVNKSRIGALSAQLAAETGRAIRLRFVNNLSTMFRQWEACAHLQRLTLRQLDDIGLTVAERDALAGLPRR